MKRKTALRAAVTALVAMAAVAIVFVPSAIAYVTTDQLDYPPGSTVTFSGDNSDDAGYLPLEFVRVEVSGPNDYASSCEAITDFSGAWSCQVTLAVEFAAGTYTYTATGQTSGVSESGVFTDATLTLFEDVGLTIQRNAFAYGETIHARGTALNASRCARVQWIDRDSNIVETDEVVADATGTITVGLSFTVPATGPSGIWSAKLRTSSALTCPAPTYNTTGESTQIFDVAQKVIVGAGSPSTTTADNPGGDNFVNQAVPSTVQGSPAPAGLGNRLIVQSRTTLNRRTFVQFDVAGAGIPPLATITDAKLRLFTTKFPTTCTTPRTYDLQPADAAWSEGTITWNNQPGLAAGTTPSSVSVPGFSTGVSPYLRIGVTDHVQDFLDAPLTNHGWRLKDQVEGFSGVGCDTQFASTENGLTQKQSWPVLLVDYEGPLVTNSSLCTFDVNPDRDGSQFRLIFTPDQLNSTPTDPRWKLNASNPGQFFFNVFVAGTPGSSETITLTLPYPFVTQGANPVHVFDDVTVEENGATCLVPGTEIPSSADPATVALGDYTGSTIDVEVTFTFPSSGFAYIAIHLDYGLKHVASKCKPDNKTNLNVTCDLPSSTPINNHAPYTFFFSNVATGNATVENENVVKNDPGIGGLVTSAATGDPVAGVTVEIYNSSGKKLATRYTDADGWYQWTFKYTGKAATFVVKLPAYTLQQSVTLKSNGYVVVNFTVP